MMTGPAMSLYMCQSSGTNKRLQRFLSTNSTTTTAENLSADFCYPFRTSIFDLDDTSIDKKSTEMNVHTFDDNLIRRVEGPMEAPKRFSRKTKHLTKRERKEKWNCRCNCSDHATEECSNEDDEAMIKELNRMCNEAQKREQKKEDEWDLLALAAAVADAAADLPTTPLDTYRDQPLVPGDAQDCVIAPWPSGGRVDEDVNGVVGREDGWCLIEHDVKVDGAKDLLEGVKGQS